MKKQEFYSAEILSALKKKNTIRRVFLYVFILMALAVCIFLCTRVNTENEKHMELTVMAVSTVCGWIALYFGTFSLRTGKKEEALSGIVTVSDRLIRIPGSITICPVTLNQDGEIRHLNLCASKRKAFPDTTEKLIVYTVDSFIVGYEAEV